MDINIIFGPPGTGKTTELLNVLEKELKQYGPEEIAYVSFTREGVGQGKKRAMFKFGYSEKDFPYFRTLHSIAFKELNLTRDQVINKYYYKQFSDKIGMHFTGYYTEDLKNNDDRYLFFNLLHRNNAKTANSYLYNLDSDLVRFVGYNYKAFKKLYGILDFTDMIEFFNSKRKALPVKIAIIDEAQDLTTLQWVMIWTAFKDCKTIYIAGDDDQAIYEWSGADVHYFLNLSGNIQILKHSYRLPDSIVNFSKNITTFIQKRIIKDYHGTGLKGSVEWLLSLQEIRITNNETWMFLSRNHLFLKKIVEYIQAQGLIYKLNGNISIAEKNIAAIILFEKIRKKKMFSNQDKIRLRPFLRSRVSLKRPWYDNFKWSGDEIKYYRDVISHGTNIHICNIKINTIHSVKGDEADNVVVLLDVTRQVNINMEYNSDSEYRVLYVACTRAKKKLFIVEAESPYRYKVLKEWMDETR